MTSSSIALQLYSVRDYMEKNPREGYQRVKEAGYDYVETAGNYGLEPEQIRTMLDDAGLRAMSMHVGYDLLVGRLEQTLQQARVLGVEYVVVPWLGAESCPDRDAWLKVVETMNNVGKRFQTEGYVLCYHNHAHEFTCLEDETIFDLIFNNSDANYVKMELDLCWATVGGANIVELLERYKGRVPLVHVKDYKKTGDVNSVVFTELGKGVMDWQQVLQAASNAGARWFIVEQDVSEQDTVESARENNEYLFKCFK